MQILNRFLLQIRSGIGSAFYSFKKVIGAAGKAVDDKSGL
jgi:hypothetical protein